MFYCTSVGEVMEKVKNWWASFNLKKWASDIGGSSADAIQAAVYFGLSFAIGFLFKKYFKFMFVSLFLSVVIIKILEYNHFIDIDWQSIRACFVNEQATDINSSLNLVFEWIKNNLLFFVSSLVGFLIGYKLG